jgi:hypothetical protein
MVGLIVSEAVRYAEIREQVRHGDVGPEAHQPQAHHPA